MKRFDVAIVGGGPAGLAAALWATELGMSAIIVERELEFGGQLLNIHNRVTNYLGAAARNGRDLRDQFLATVAGLPFERITRAEVINVEPGDRSLRFGDGRTVEWCDLVAATGVRRRRLGVAGEDEFVGKGVLRSGALEKTQVAGGRVVIVGGGDAALENALILSEHAEKVTVVHRSSEFRARQEFMDRVKASANVEIMPEAVLTAIRGDDHVRGVEVAATSLSPRKCIDADFVLVRIGVAPNSEWLAGVVDLDPQGYIKVNESAETSAPAIFACGDVANPKSPTIATGTGTAATALKNINLLREMV